MLVLALLAATPSHPLPVPARLDRQIADRLGGAIVSAGYEETLPSDDPNAYFNPTYGLIALGVGALLGLTWAFAGEPVSRLRGDPLPGRIRNRLERLDALRLDVLAAARAARAHLCEAELREEQAAYDALAGEIDELLDKLRRDLLLNLVDEDFLTPALASLCDRARGLSFRLRRLAPVGASISALVPRQGMLSRITRGWDRVFAAEPPKMATIRQLGAMRWPSWSRIEASLRPPA